MWPARSKSHFCPFKNFKSPIVDFVPGIMTKSASPGIALPALSMIRLILGSCDSGSKSSKFAILERHRHTTLNLDFGLFVERMSIESSAGNFQALSNHGTTPSPFHSVIFSIELYPSSNKLVSPLNLLITKPSTIFSSTKSMTAFVPTI